MLVGARAAWCGCAEQRQRSVSHAPSGESEASSSLVAELTGTLDLLVNQPLVSAALFGGDGPLVARYRVEGRLGAGATAVVYAARDTLLDRPVALKVLARRDLSGAWRERARQEACALARLSHPNVVAVHDVGEWQGYSFVAMELVRGETLARWQASQRREWRQILRHYLAAGRGLEAAHLIGLVHRDFKPANVLVAEAGRVVVTDFGLAVHVEAAGAGEGASTGANGVARPAPVVVGTPAYLAPEQRAGATPKPAADVYSFAVSVCEALIGGHPLLEPGIDWRRALSAAGVPRSVRRALESGLSADPAQRWPSLGPLLAAIEAALPSDGARTRRALGIAGAIGLVLLAGIAGLVASSLEATSSALSWRAAPLNARVGPGVGHTSSATAVSVARELVARDPTAAAALLLEAGPDERRDEWAAVARATLLRPIATEVPCQRSDNLKSLSAAHGLLATVDALGNASVCELGSARVSLLAVTAICARVLDAHRVGVFTEDGGFAIADARKAWRVQRLADAGVEPRELPARPSRCERDLANAGPEAVIVRRANGEQVLVDLSASTPPMRIEGDWPRPTLVAISRDRRRALLRDAAGDLRLTGQFPRLPHGAPVLASTAEYVAHDDEVTMAVVITGTAGTLVDLREGAVVKHQRVPVLEKAYGFLQIAPAGRLAVVATSRGELFWWPLGAHGQDRPWVESVTDARIMEIAFDSTGEKLVWRDSFGTIGVRDVGTSRGFELSVRQPFICHVSFAGDDRVVAVGCDGRVIGWNLGDQRAFTAGRHDLAHCRPGCDSAARAIWSTSLSEDGSMAATAGFDGTVGIWPTRPGADAAARGRRLQVGQHRRVYSTRFEGQHLYVGANEGLVQVWNWVTGQRLTELRGHETWAYALAIARPTSDAVTVVTGSKASVLRFWQGEGAGLRLRATTPLLATSSNSRVNDIAVSPSGRRVAAALDSGHVVVCDAQSAAVTSRVLAHAGWARRVRFLDDETLLSAGDDGRVHRIDAATGRLIDTLGADDAPIYDMDLLGELLLTASATGSVRLWDLSSGMLVRTYVGHDHFAGTVRWHPRGSWFVTGSTDHRACLWAVESSACHTWLVGHSDEVRTAQFVDSEQVLTASFDGTMRIWTPFLGATVDSLGAELARRRPPCLSEKQRQTYLDEPAPDAAARVAACRSRWPAIDGSPAR